MFPLPPRPMDTRYGVVTTGCSPLLLLLDVMARYGLFGLSISSEFRVLGSTKKFSRMVCGIVA
jgi:hypothetical protein